VGEDSSFMASRWLGAVLAATLLLVACESDTPVERDPLPGPIATPTSSESLVIGLVATMSGPDAWRGEDAFEGAQVGVHEINSGPTGGAATFELVTLDDRGDPRRAVELIGQLAGSDRTVGIVYAGPPEALPEAEGVLADAGIPAILCFGDLHTAGLLSAHLFQVSPPIRWQATRIATYLFADRRYRTSGAIVQRSLAGRQATTALHVSFNAEGARRPKVASYASEQDIRDALKELRRAQVEALVVQGGPSMLSAVATELESMDALYRSSDAARVASAPPRVRRARIRGDWWRPQVIGLAETAGTLDPGVVPAGTAAADSYVRGAHYLAIPSLEEFRGAFDDWWGTGPNGWEQRSFEAVGMIGWAARRAGVDGGSGDTDLAPLLEGLRDRRFGGLAVDFGPSDHTAVDPRTIGLWVVPAGATPESSQLPRDLPWVPLARTFAGPGGKTRIPRSDWAYLFRDPLRGSGRVRAYTLMRYGVTSPRRDPIH
jgi:Periplasmic binding protein